MKVAAAILPHKVAPVLSCCSFYDGCGRTSCGTHHLLQHMLNDTPKDTDGD